MSCSLLDLNKRSLPMLIYSKCSDRLFFILVLGLIYLELNVLFADLTSDVIERYVHKTSISDTSCR